MGKQVIFAPICDGIPVIDHLYVHGYIVVNDSLGLMSCKDIVERIQVIQSCYLFIASSKQLKIYAYPFSIFYHHVFNPYMPTLHRRTYIQARSVFSVVNVQKNL